MVEDLSISKGSKEEKYLEWVGFYIVKDKELVLGPFQGPIFSYIMITQYLPIDTGVS